MSRAKVDSNLSFTELGQKPGIHAFILFTLHPELRSGLSSTRNWQPAQSRGQKSTCHQNTRGEAVLERRRERQAAYLDWPTAVFGALA